MRCSIFWLFVLCLAANGHRTGGDPLPSQPTLTASMGWQYGKTLAECNQYMFDHQVATDVEFQVGPRGQARSLFRAHRYILLSRSAVFTRLLQENNVVDRNLLPVTSAERNDALRSSGRPLQTIDIPDVDPAVFRHLLSFLYTDDVKLDLQNVFSVMYASREFQLPKLKNICQEFLQQSLTTDNACMILEQVVNFNEETLIDKILKFIGLNTKQVIQSRGFLELSRKSLNVLLAYDGLDGKESALVQPCIEWMKLQMLANGTPPDAVENMKNIRRALGELFYLIRFPIMDYVEFARLVGSNELFTSEEKASIYYYMATSDHQNNTLAFNYNSREIDRVLDRFPQNSGNEWRLHGHQSSEKIQFRVSKKVYLKAVGSYVPEDANPFLDSGRHTKKKISIFVLVARSNQRYSNSDYTETKICETVSFEIPMPANNEGKDRIFKIPFDQTILLEPGYYYTITLQVPDPPTYGVKYLSSGTNGREEITDAAGLKFTFNSAGTNTNAIQGQIPRLYYRIV